MVEVLATTGFSFHLNGTETVDVAKVVGITAYYGDVRFFVNMVFQKFIVIHLVDTVCGSNYYVRLVTVL